MLFTTTETLLAYRQHAQGERRRFKIRCRRYVDSDLYFVEVKLKGTRGRTTKQRMVYDDARHGQATLDDAATDFRAALRRGQPRRRLRRAAQGRAPHALAPPDARWAKAVPNG